MAPTGCLPGDVNEDGFMDIITYHWGRLPVAFIRNEIAAAPGVLHSVVDDGWVQSQAGRFRVATYVAKVAGADGQLAPAVCSEGANGGAAN